MFKVLPAQSAQQEFRRSGRFAVAAFTLALMSACGGGGSDVAPTATGVTSVTGTTGTTGTSPGGDRTDATSADSGPAPGRAEAFRLLTQASFGPTEADLAQVSSQGVTAWIDAQLALPAQAAHLPRWKAATAALQGGSPGAFASPVEVVQSFYQQALQAEDQLRQRVAFALSEIFVVSLLDMTGERAQTVADFQDMLGRNAFGNFRTLLQDVALHPAMGDYLSHLKNRKADGLGRMPDQNFAREVMQLFSIGLHRLNLDGSPQRDGAGSTIDAYSSDDIEGMASVFTGFSFAGPDTGTPRFYGHVGYRDAEMWIRPMQGYSQFHATTAKSFLGATVAAQNTAAPHTSLTLALDTLADHPNIGPFIGRQLIQRLVTSHPSPGYVARVAAAFNNNGLGTRGDMKAVVRAILTDAEARDASRAQDPRYGKLREPVLRLTAFLRAFKAKSDSGKVLMTVTDNPTDSLGQSPYRSPSVFNHFRPGYVPTGGEAGAAGMTVPEMQITAETTVSGYANFMMGVVARGVGYRGTNDQGTRPDLQPDYSAELALADRPAELTDRVLSRLLPEASPALASEITAAVTSIAVPAPNGQNAADIATAQRNRVQAAILLALVSPEFIVQK